MKDEKVITEQKVHENPLLAMSVEKDTPLKKVLVEHTGVRLNTEEVTVNMIAEVLALDFPEFVFAFAEENFLRGYQQGLDDAVTLSKTITQ